MFDAVTLAAVADELKEKVLHGRVQEIVQLDALAFAFEIYSEHTRRYLLATVHPDAARVHLVSQKLRGSGGAPSGLLLLLRKYAEGAFVDAVEQLPHERVLKIRLDHASEGISDLIVETIGRYSNLILVDAAGTVVAACRRVTSTMNRARVTLPGQVYVPPPPQAKLDPSGLDVAQLTLLLEKNRGALLRQVLVQNIAGVSPLLAREIAYRVDGSIDSEADPAQASSISGGLEGLTHAPWHPTVAVEDGAPAEYAPYVLTQYPENHPFDSISLATETYYGAGESYAAAKEPLRGQLTLARDRLERKRAALAQSLPNPAEIERLRVSGELILAYAFQIQEGQAALRAETEQGDIDVTLDPSLTPVENAQAYFKEYHRAKDAAAKVPALLHAAAVQVNYAEQMLNDLEIAENRGEIDAVVQSAREAGLLTQGRARSRVPASEPRTVQSQDGFAILVGRNARQNEEITFHRARPDDLWLHVRNVAGSHVVIVRGGREIPESTILEAATLAAHYSQARDQSRVDVMVAPRRNVHRMRGGKAGMVTVGGERTVVV